MEVLSRLPEDEVRGILLSQDYEVVRAAVSIVRDHLERVLMLLRTPESRLYPNMWVFPGGKVDEGETPIQAGQRELKEETGLDLELTEVYGRRLFLDKIGKKYLIFDCYIYLAAEVVNSSATEVIINIDEHYMYEWVSRSTVTGMDFGYLTYTIANDLMSPVISEEWPTA